MFNSKNINEIKAEDIQKAHEELDHDEFLRIFFKSTQIDLLPNKKFTINKYKLCVDNLVGYTNEIILFDTLKMLKE